MKLFLSSLIIVIVMFIGHSFIKNHFLGSNHSKISFYVSPAGNDSNYGSKSSPYKTLEKAKNEIKNEVKKNKNAKIYIYLKDGNYFIDHTLTFTKKDSPSDEGLVQWSSVNNKKAIIIGAVKIENWKKCENIPSEIKSSLKDRIYSVKIPVINGKMILPKVLYSKNGRLNRAKGQGFVPTAKAKRSREIEMGRKTSINDTIILPKGAMKKWSNLEDAELIIRPTFGWTMNILPIVEVNEKQGFARTKIPATYPMRPLMWQNIYHYGKESCWVENIFEAMGKTGDWVLDSKRGLLYLVTDGTIPTEDIYAPVLEEFIRFKGEENQGLVKNLILKNIVFKYADRDT